MRELRCPACNTVWRAEEPEDVRCIRCGKAKGVPAHKSEKEIALRLRLVDLANRHSYVVRELSRLSPENAKKIRGRG